MSADFFDLVLVNQNEFGFLLWDFVRDYPLHSLTLLITLILFFILENRLSFKTKMRKRISVNSFIFSIISILIIVFLIRGPYARPLSIVDANRHNNNPKLIPFVLNSPFTIVHTIGYKSLEPSDFYPDKKVEQIFSPVHPSSNKGEMTKKNVVVVILESFSGEYSAFLNPKINEKKERGFTPFLDSLMKHSIVFQGYANGKTSAEGIPSVLSGIPSLMDKALIFSAYSSNHIASIASYLKTEGYYSAFFHGGTNGTMNFEPYCKQVGFDDYFGRSQYNNDHDFDGNWGIFDEPFLQYTGKKMDEFQQPFVAAIFTLSSHHPFTIPDKYKSRFTDSYLPILKSIEYADFSLQRFFHSIQDKTWFDNTIFVFSADHTAVSKDEFFNNAVGQFCIPIFIYEPNKEGYKSSKIMQQTDILPSILDYLHYPNCSFAFGQSIYDSLQVRFSVHYRNGQYNLITDSLLATFDASQLKIKKLYNYKNDSLLKKNILKNENKKALLLQGLLRAYMQQYNNRMIQNKLQCDEPN
jgi:phosphoglycerol transferase MdoB-like AlkP superfamily enzyme